jgi:hypothetical protein
MNLGLPPKKLKYSNEDKVKKKKLLKFLCYILFWIPTKHSLWIFFAFANLLVKLSFFKKLCNLRKLLYYFTTCRIIWRWLEKYRLYWHGTYFKLLLIPLALLYLFIFWTNIKVVGFKWCIKRFHIHEFKIQGWSWLCNL